MALSLKSDGLGAANKFTHDWVDDFTNLLTGVMHDQDVTLDYRPGSANGKNTLTLKGDGNNPLLKGMKADGTTQAFLLDSGGALTVASTVKSNPASVPGATTSYVIITTGGDGNGRTSLGVRSDGAGNIRFGNNGSSYATELYTDGSKLKISTATDVAGALAATSLAVTGAATANGGHTLVNFRAKGTGANAGVNVWICPSGTDPTVGDGLTDGDLVFSY